MEITESERRVNKFAQIIWGKEEALQWLWKINRDKNKFTLRSRIEDITETLLSLHFYEFHIRTDFPKIKKLFILPRILKVSLVLVYANLMFKTLTQFSNSVCANFFRCGSLSLVFFISKVSIFPCTRDCQIHNEPTVMHGMICICVNRRKEKNSSVVYALDW